MQLELNLRKFEEDRRRFELERLRFIQQKRELDRMRLARFEKYKSEVLGREPHLLVPLDPFKTRIDSPMPKRNSHRSKSAQKVKQKKVIDYESSTVDEASDVLESEDDRKLLSDFIEDKDSFRKTVELEIDAHMKQSVRLDPGFEFQIRQRSASSQKRSSSRGRHSQDLKMASAPTTPAPDVLLTSSGVEKDHVDINGNFTINTQPPVTKELIVSEEVLKIESVSQKAIEEEFKEVEDDQDKPLPKKGLKAKIIPILRDLRNTWKQLKAARSKDWNQIRAHSRRCFSHLFLFTIFIGIGGLLFRYVGGKEFN